MSAMGTLIARLESMPDVVAAYPIGTGGGCEALSVVGLSEVLLITDDNYALPFEGDRVSWGLGVSRYTREDGPNGPEWQADGDYLGSLLWCEQCQGATVEDVTAWIVTAVTRWLAGDVTDVTLPMVWADED